MKLSRYFAGRCDRPPTSREILLALIEQGDIQTGPDGQATITFSPDAATLDALMGFDAIEREDEQIKEDFSGTFRGSGERVA